MFGNMANQNIQLFDRQTIDTLEWPNTAEGEKARKFLEPLVKNGISYYIDNIGADIFVLKIDQFVFPIIAAQKNYQDSFICSTYGQYISYAKESLQLIGNRFLERCARGFLTALGMLLRLGSLNSVVYVNHWLFSTDLYPEGITPQQIEEITALLVQRFPGHAIVFRSLNSLTSAALMEQLKSEDFQLIASRQVFITNPKNPSIYKTPSHKRDLKLYKNNHFQVLDGDQLSSEECPEFLKLYQSLCLDHHSYLNPQFNSRFIQLVFEQRLLDFKAVKHERAIKGMAGYYICEGVMMSILFGYAKEDPEHMEIYRILNTSLLLEAQKRQLMFHQCSGASFYKSTRGAERCMDFMAVYTQHLSFKQKLSWSTLRGFINAAAPRYMKKY